MATNNRRPTGEIKADHAPESHASDEASANLAPVDALEETAAQRFVLAGDADELDDTGEFPAIDAAALSHAAPASDVPGERASFWLQHLESEIQRLQSKWEVVADELRVRETRIEHLRVEGEAKDAFADGLRQDLAARETANAALRAELEQLIARGAELVAAQVERDAVLAERGRELDESRAHAAAQRGELEVAAGNIERLTAALEVSRAELAAAAERHAAHVAASNALRERIQELEAYIDGRGRSWAALNAKLAEYQELETRLAQQAAAAAELRAELAAARKHGDETIVQLTHRDELVAALEHRVAQREQSIAGLEASVLAARSAETGASEERGKLVVQVADLEHAVADRDAELLSAQANLASAEAGLRGAEERIAALEQSVRAKAEESEALQAAIDARDEQLARMQAELHASKGALDLLERNVQRLNDLGASLQGLDRKLSSTEIVMAKLRPVPSSKDAATANAVFDVGAPTASEQRSRGGKMIVAVEGRSRRSYPLASANVTIGRGPQSDIRIPSPFISRRHARIFVRDRDTLIEDLGSKNGILVNSKPLAAAMPLHHGDVISLGGELELRFVDVERTNGAAP